MSTSVLCISQDHAQTSRIVDQLYAAGFSTDDVSVLFSDTGTSRDFGHEKETKMPEGVAIGAGAGGVLGAALGLLAGIGTLAIPGLGAFIAAGPIMAALSGGAIGAGTMGIAGGLIGLGIPEFEAKRYEGKITAGGTLISAHCENSDEVDLAKKVFAREEARDIAAMGEATATVTPPTEFVV